MAIRIDQLQKELKSFKECVNKPPIRADNINKASSPCLFNHNGNGGSLHLEYDYKTKRYSLIYGDFKINIE